MQNDPDLRPMAANLITALLIAAAVFAVLNLLTGCAGVRFAKTKTMTTEVKRGVHSIPVSTPTGVQVIQAPFTEVITRDEMETTDEATHTAPDVPAIAAAGTAIAGSVAGSVAPGMGLGELAGAAVAALTAGVTGAAALHGRARASEKAKEAAEAWEEAERHRQRAEEYALRLPPPKET